ncbi:FecR family protein [Chitinophaga sp.]|uniref:FecR family protein n=1 Tax=Chitinophaga sp. TaxID=1869181 RepID=UPI002F935392
MNISKELIEKFFDKRCTETEAKEVSELLKNNPSLLNEYLSEDEWNAIVAGKEMPEAFWDEAWQQIQEDKPKGRSAVMVLKRVAVAAAVVLLLGAGYYTWKGTGNREIPQLAAAPRKVISNTTQQLMQLVLPDSSRVELSPASELSYDEPFGKAQRNIVLKGEALFTVVKNDRQPFTVYSNALATTALGTTFRVLSYETDNTIKVQLIEGKVVVKAADSAQVKLDKDYFLTPGESLLYNKARMTASLIHAPMPSKDKHWHESGEAVGNWYMFSKAPLAAVFDQLSDMYGVPVNYNKADLEDLYFIGKFDKTDSLKNILQTIGQLNNLTVEQMKNGGYVIKK